MSHAELTSLAQVFTQVRDFRDPRGKRHPLPALLSLVFLGLLARIREMAVLQRWAETHWDELQEPLGFTRDERPHATTISRALGSCSLADFSQAFLHWVQQMLPAGVPLVAAVDGKTSCQGLDPAGKPVHMLNVFVHELKLVLGQWSVHGEKSNEPTVLRNHLSELFAHFPMLRLITGDALFAQRPLAQALLEQNCDYLLQIKGNQPETLDALQNCLGDLGERPPAAETVEKKGTPPIAAGSGSTWRTPLTFASNWDFPGRKLRCVLIGT
jgi:DDE_Tnp_1-associated